MPANPTVQRYAHPATHGWLGSMEPADSADWVLFADLHGRCRMFLARTEHGAVLPPMAPANEVIQ